MAITYMLNNAIVAVYGLKGEYMQKDEQHLNLNVGE